MIRKILRASPLPWMLPVVLWCSLALAAGCNEREDAVEERKQPAPAPEAVKLMPEYTTYSKFPGHFSDASLEPWKKVSPDIEDIRITSTADGTPQPALFYDPPTEEPRPLLVALHSWSSGYLQAVSIPYAVWAVRNEWVMIHPDYRGINNNPDATASDLAVQDIVDAVEYAKLHAEVDATRIYLIGFSGGALTALVMVGRHPELWTAVAAWVPVYSLVEWYPYVLKYPDRNYKAHIEASCGGVPRPGSKAEESCTRRSPSAWLANARNRGLSVFLATGIDDDYVPPDHSLKAFNLLADPGDRFPQKIMDNLVTSRRIPDSLRGTYSDSLYTAAGAPLLFERRSGNATLAIFKGGHDVVYNAGLLWLSRQREE
ncbi:MAG: alpha/beta hydrolase family protein [Candidatus Latescibacterota bacterium]